MDAVKFINERVRMCDSIANGTMCAGCPLREFACDFDSLVRQDKVEEAVELVEKWSNEHPRKTRQSLFLEQWPNAEIDCQGVIAIDPCDIDKTMHGGKKDCYNGDCEECRAKFWGKEME